MDSDLGDRIAFLIRSNGLRQNAFAESVDVTPAFISDVINRGKSPSTETLRKISHKYDVNLHWLITGIGNPKLAKNSEIENSISTLEELRVQHFQTNADPELKEAIKAMRDLANRDRQGFEIVRNMIEKLHGK